MQQKASKLIIKRSTTMDGQLFLIKHLLILREQVMAELSLVCFFCYLVNGCILNKIYICFQIAPFDIEFSVTHKELDFSHLLVSSSTFKSTLYNRSKPLFFAFDYAYLWCRFQMFFLLKFISFADDFANLA